MLVSVDLSASGDSSPRQEMKGEATSAGDDATAESGDGDDNSGGVDSKDAACWAVSSSTSTASSTGNEPLLAASGAADPSPAAQEGGGPEEGSVTAITLMDGPPPPPTLGLPWTISSSVDDSNSSSLAGMDIEDPGWNRPVIPDPPALVSDAGSGGRGSGGIGGTADSGKCVRTHNVQEWGKPRRVSTGAVMNKLFSRGQARQGAVAPLDGSLSLATGARSGAVDDEKGGRGGGGGDDEDPILKRSAEVERMSSLAPGIAAPQPSETSSQLEREPSTAGKSASHAVSTAAQAEGDATVVEEASSATSSSSNAGGDTNSSGAGGRIGIPQAPRVSLFQPPPEALLHTALRNAPVLWRPRSPQPEDNAAAVVTTPPPCTMEPHSSQDGPEAVTPAQEAITTASREMLGATNSDDNRGGRADMDMNELLQQTATVAKAVQHRGRGLISFADASAAAGSGGGETDGAAATATTATGAASGGSARAGRREGRADDGGLLSSSSETLSPVKRRAKSLPPFWPGDARRARRRRGGPPRPPRKKIEKRLSMLGPTAVIENLALDDDDGDAGEEGRCGEKEGGWASGQWVSAGGEWGDGSDEDGGEDGTPAVPGEAMHVRRATTLVG